MNKLYKLPLHGIACRPFCDLQNHKSAYAIHVSFEQFDPIAFNANKLIKPHWVMKDTGERYKTEVSLYIDNDTYQLNIDCQGQGQFTFNKNNLVIKWNELGTDSSHYLQTLASALWLELNQVLCVHANALAYGHSAIALMAPSRTGKTTLTAELCKSDFELMTDDMIALHKCNSDYKVYPSWPVVRMWPETLGLIEHDQNKHELLKVHEKFDKKTIEFTQNNGFGFCSQAKKLTTIYILNRLDEEHQSSELSAPTVCNIKTIPPSQAIILLLQNSILGSAYSALNIEAQRLTEFIKVLNKIEVKKITYVSGKKNLKIVKQHILKDLQKTIKS